MLTRTARNTPSHNRYVVTLIGLALATLATPSAAAPVAVTNPGFEDISGETPVNEFTFGPLNGWGLYDPSSITAGGAGPSYFMGTLTPFEPDPIGNPGVYAFFPAGAIEGQRVGIAFNYFGTGGLGEWGMVQVLGATLEPDVHYTLRVQIGNIASGTSIGGGFFPLDGFPGYRVELLANADVPGSEVVIAQDNNTLAGSIADGDWAESVVQLTTTSSHPHLGQTLGIRLINLNVVDPAFPSSDLEVDFDDVRLDATAVPAAVPAFSPGGLMGIAISLAWIGAARAIDCRA